MGVIVDTNHSNSGKQYEEQIRISKDVMHSCHVSPDLHKFVKGLMIESYLEDGSQKVERTLLWKIHHRSLPWLAGIRAADPHDLQDVREINGTNRKPCLHEKGMASFSLQERGISYEWKQ